MFCDGLFLLASSRDGNVRGVMVEAAPGKSADLGDLMDSHAWSTMELVMFSTVTDVILFHANIFNILG